MYQFKDQPTPPSSQDVETSVDSSVMATSAEGVPELLTHSMHWMWKLTFMAAVSWTIPIFIDEVASRFLSAEDMFVAICPLSLWFTARWIHIGRIVGEQPK